MSDEDFGFSDEEVAKREVDDFADMSEEEFDFLMKTAERVMEMRAVKSRRMAIEVAKGVILSMEVVVAGSGKAGYRRHGVDRFRELVMDALVRGEKPCTHGHIEPITFCGTCEVQKHANKRVMNPTKQSLPPLCDHTRLDYSTPCPSCIEDEEDALELKLAEREKFRASLPASYTKNYHVTYPKRYGKKSALERLVGDELAKANVGPVPKHTGGEAEMNALIGVLLDRLGGEVHLSPEDLEQIADMTQAGTSTFAISPSIMTMGITVERLGSTGSPRYSVSGFVRPPQQATSNPSGATGDPTWLSLDGTEDDGDIPF